MDRIEVQNQARFSPAHLVVQIGRDLEREHDAAAIGHGGRAHEHLKARAVAQPLEHAWRRPERFAALVDAALAGEAAPQAARARIETALRAAAAVDGGEIARNARDADAIRERLRAARLAAVQEAVR